MIKKIKNLFTNKIYSSIKENFLSLTILQLFSMLMPLIVLPYIINVLGYELYGTIILAITFISYFQSITDYSFKITATRDIAIHRQSNLRLGIIYSKVMIVKTIFLLLSLLIIVLIVYIYEPFYEYKWVFYATLLSLIGNYLFPDWFFQGIERMKYITIINVLVRLFFTLLVFMFIKDKEDYLLYPIFQGLGFLFAGIFGQIILLKKYKVPFYWINKKHLLASVNNNFPIFINQVFPMLYNNTTSLILGIIEGNTLLGIFNAVKKIIELIVTMIGVFSRVFFPVLNVKKNMFKTYRKLLLIFVLLAIVFTIIFKSFVFSFLSITMEGKTELLLILLVGVIGYTLYDIYGLNYFIVKKQDKIVMNNTIISSVVGFLLIFPLIKWFGVFGAAINISFSRWLMGGMLFIKYKKNKK